MNTLNQWYTSSIDYINFISQNPANITPWLLSLMSLLCVYFLNNHKVMLGRYVGLGSAIAWGTYGVMVDQWFFLVNHSIFALMYISAIVKFNSKKEEYRALSEEQYAQILKLKKDVENARISQERVFERRHKYLKDLASSVEKQAKSNQDAARKIMEELEKDIPDAKKNKAA